MILLTLPTLPSIHLCPVPSSTIPHYLGLSLNFQEQTLAGCQWLTPAILATQEDHQPGQIVPETLSQKYPSQKRAGLVAQGVGPESKSQYHKKKKKQTLNWKILGMSSKVAMGHMEGPCNPISVGEKLRNWGGGSPHKWTPMLLFTGNLLQGY
jgi:hypothetical protein